MADTYTTKTPFEFGPGAIVFRNATFGSDGYWNRDGAAYTASFEKLRQKVGQEWFEMAAYLEIETPTPQSDDKKIFISDKGEIAVSYNTTGTPEHTAILTDQGRADYYSAKLKELHEKLTKGELSQQAFAKGMETLWDEAQKEVFEKGRPIEAVPTLDAPLVYLDKDGKAITPDVDYMKGMQPQLGNAKGVYSVSAEFRDGKATITTMQLDNDGVTRKRYYELSPKNLADIEAIQRIVKDGKITDGREGTPDDVSAILSIAQHNQPTETRTL